MCIGNQDTPVPPDYAAAAKEQAQSSKEVTEQQTWANRPDQSTPFGTQQWQNQGVWDPVSQQYLNRWSQETKLSDPLQGVLDDQIAVQGKRSDLALGLSDRLQREMGTPLNYGNLPRMGESVNARNYGDTGTLRNRMEDNLYNRATSRLDPQWSNRGSDLRAQLYNMGAKEGDPAYERAMQEFGRDRNDAYQQAQYGAIAGGGIEQANEIGMGGQIQGQQQQASGYQNQLRQQALAEALQRRGASLNEINATMSGQQVGLPSMPSFTNAGQSQGVQALQGAGLTGQANLDIFNTQQQQQQGMMQGAAALFGGLMS